MGLAARTRTRLREKGWEHVNGWNGWLQGWRLGHLYNRRSVQIMIIVSGSPKSQQHMICETMIRMFSTSKTCQKMMRYKVKREQALFENMCIIISYREWMSEPANDHYATESFWYRCGEQVRVRWKDSYRALAGWHHLPDVSMIAM